MARSKFAMSTSERRLRAGEATILIISQIVRMHWHGQMPCLEISPSGDRYASVDRQDIEGGANIARQVEGLQPVEGSQNHVVHAVELTSHVTTYVGLVEHHGGIPRARHHHWVAPDVRHLVTKLADERTL